MADYTTVVRYENTSLLQVSISQEPVSQIAKLEESYFPSLMVKVLGI